MHEVIAAVLYSCWIRSGLCECVSICDGLIEVQSLAYDYGLTRKVK